ncbi:sugar kinase [Thioflexithrix psekupsensis]|uniref:Sugar kinase n=1 Tax=Thioflexithrix psekupsensis TaxID=1570016 RepID=A0A251X7Z7_9GAMM|nr:sugar kinase [Thioflexithrix psekupsensis]OUD13914.1 sugar kinase [Thioflexithrix psekupsensis]
MDTKFDYAIIVKSKTRLELLIERFNTKGQAKFYIENLGGDFSEYEREHDTFYEALNCVQKDLSTVLKNKIIDKAYLPSFIFSEKYLIVVVGRDGLVANTAKYSKNCPIIAVNPDPENYDGVLLPFDVETFSLITSDFGWDLIDFKTVHFAKVTLNDGQELLAFNDLFIGINSHASARYEINFEHQIEVQSSSGIIVSTAIGATGWLSAVFNMAYGVVGSLEENLQAKQPPQLSDKQLLFVVREPFKSVSTQSNVVTGLIEEGRHLIIKSLMPTNGIIFSDGIESDFLKFNSGAVATIRISEEKAVLVVLEDLLPDMPEWDDS